MMMMMMMMKMTTMTMMEGTVSHYVTVYSQ